MSRCSKGVAGTATGRVRCLSGGVEQAARSQKATRTLCGFRILCPVGVPEEALVDRFARRAEKAALRPADRQHGATRTTFGEAEPLVDFFAEAGVDRRQRRPEADSATGEQDVLNRGEQRLNLGLAAPRPTRDKE